MNMNDKSLRVLMIDDSEDDVLLIIREIAKGGNNPVYERVETAAAMKKALEEKKWDIILCDYKMPNFNVPSAIAILKEANIDIPLIIVSGTISGDMVAECMRLGARDCIMKSNLSGLYSAIVRELEDSEVRSRQKQTESPREDAPASLYQREEKYQNILETIQEAYFEVDLTGNFTFFNSSLCRITGYPKEELLGMNNRQFTDKKTSKEVFQAFNKVYNTGEPSQEFGWQIIRKDGAKRYIEVSISLQKDLSGKRTGFKGILRDITDRKRVEEKLQQNIDSLKKAVGATMQIMVSAVESRDPYTYGHQLRSANLACAIATEMGLSQDKMDAIRMAGSLYDIGKLSIPAQILSKPTELTSVEISLIKEHPRSGYEILKGVESPWPLAEIVYQHHERMNGSGYPRKLKGDKILMEARVLAVSDVVESMAALRPYRPALGIEVALEEIKRNKGILYDDAVVESCLRLFQEKS
jgi:PAS domain S-box-containing protein